MLRKLKEAAWARQAEEHVSEPLERKPRPMWVRVVGAVFGYGSMLLAWAIWGPWGLVSAALAAAVGLYAFRRYEKWSDRRYLEQPLDDDQ